MVVVVGFEDVVVALVVVVVGLDVVLVDAWDVVDVGADVAVVVTLATDEDVEDEAVVVDVP